MEGVTYFLLALVVLVPIWAMFFLLRRRYGTGGRAFNVPPVRVANRDTPVVRLTDPRDRPGHCSTCGEPIDDAEYTRCWNCAKPVRH